MAAKAAKGEMDDSPGSRPDLDPTERTIDSIHHAVVALRRELAAISEIAAAHRLGIREVFDTRLDGMDKALALLQVFADRQPTTTTVSQSVSALETLVVEKFASIDVQMDTRFGGIATQIEARFDGVATQFLLADKAIAAALQAQKEASGATNESNTTANNKMEATFVKLIDQTQTLLQAAVKNMDDKINDLKSRLDKGEGRTSISDPAITENLRMLTGSVNGLGTYRDTTKGHSEGIGMIGTIAVGFIAFAALVVGIISLLTKGA